MLPHQKPPSNGPTAKHYCASQRLHEKLKNHNKQKQQLYDALDIELSDKNTINEPVPSEHLSRSKRWLADEVSHSAYFLFGFSKKNKHRFRCGNFTTNIIT